MKEGTFESVIVATTLPSSSSCAVHSSSPLPRLREKERRSAQFLLLVEPRREWSIPLVRVVAVDNHAAVQVLSNLLDARARTQPTQWCGGGRSSVFTDRVGGPSGRRKMRHKMQFE